MDELLRFLGSRASDAEEYLVHLRYHLHLCSKPVLVQEGTPDQLVLSSLRRHLELLAEMLSEVPSEETFHALAGAIERLLAYDPRGLRTDAASPQTRRAAAQTSQIPIILVRLMRVASAHTYPALLVIAATLASLGRASCELASISLRLEPYVSH